jgi:hypothetical protein
MGRTVCSGYSGHIDWWGTGRVQECSERGGAGHFRLGLQRKEVSLLHGAWNARNASRSTRAARRRARALWLMRSCRVGIQKTSKHARSGSIARYLEESSRARANPGTDASRADCRGAAPLSRRYAGQQPW